MPGKMPIYKMVVDDTDTLSGVDAVALVDVPAIEFDFMAFRAQQLQDAEKLFFTSEEQRVVAGPLMIPGLPIYRKEGDREYYVVFDEDTIKRIHTKFMRNRFTGNVNLMHNPALAQKGVFMLETYLLDEANGVTTPGYYKNKLPDGTWWAKYKVDNDEVWQRVKAGEFRGFSVEGLFGQELEAEADQHVVETLINIIRDDN